jgi:hypothetical protein
MASIRGKHPGQQEAVVVVEMAGERLFQLADLGPHPRPRHLCEHTFGSRSLQVLARDANRIAVDRNKGFTGGTPNRPKMWVAPSGLHDRLLCSREVLVSADDHDAELGSETRGQAPRRTACSPTARPGLVRRQGEGGVPPLAHGGINPNSVPRRHQRSLNATGPLSVL